MSAPMYVDNDREGRVYVCTLSGLVNVLIIFSNYDYFFFNHKNWFPLLFLQDANFKHDLVLRGSASNGGRFGSSLAALPDLNADGFNDLAVGAPMENNGQGSIYIFHGKGKGGISLTYSQVSKILIPSHLSYLFFSSCPCEPGPAQGFFLWDEPFSLILLLTI